MTQWEYYTTQEPADLSTLGRLGWELVSVVPAEGEPARLYFKRPLSVRERITEEQKRRAYAELGVPLRQWQP